MALNLKDLLVKGEFVVSYKGIEKDVKVIYGENVLYLELEGLKVKASVEEALGLVKEFVAIPETDGNAEDILLKVLSLNFGEVISVSEDGTSLSVIVKGTELLKAFGVEFELGDVMLNVTESDGERTHRFRLRCYRCGHGGRSVHRRHGRVHGHRQICGIPHRPVLQREPQSRILVRERGYCGQRHGGAQPQRSARQGRVRGLV